MIVDVQHLTRFDLILYTIRMMICSGMTQGSITFDIHSYVPSSGPRMELKSRI